MARKNAKKSKARLKLEKQRQERQASTAPEAETKSPELEKPMWMIARDESDGKNLIRDIQITNFSMALPGGLGGSDLLLSTDITLVDGRRYGLVGNNGCGKSTLLKHIASYQIQGFPKHLRVLHVQQELHGDDRSVATTVMAADEERGLLLKEEKELQEKASNTGEDHTDRLAEIHDRLEEIDATTALTRAATILSGLGFSTGMQEMSTKDLSGGWRMRVSLACALFVEPDVLMLDEPTNHLDFPAVLWLTAYLQTYEKTLMLVSHDRQFLNDVITDVIHVEHQKLKYYRGDYDTFIKVRLQQRKQQHTAYLKQQATIEKNQDFIRRFGANKKLSTLAQSRQKLLDKMEIIDDIELESQFRFSFPEPSPLRRDLLVSVNKVAFGYYGEDTTERTYLFKDVNVDVNVGQCIGVLGANGAGKSTLIKVIMAQLKPCVGVVNRNNQARVGFFAQHHMDTINMDMTPYEFLKFTFPDATHQEIYRQLGRFNLSDRATKYPISKLSGGQKSRIAFALLTWTAPHILVLDEPTNHLDLDTIDGLIYALKEYKGAVVVISHDQYFLRNVCNEFWAVGNKRLKSFHTLDTAKKYSYSLHTSNLSQLRPKDDELTEGQKEEAETKRQEEEKAKQEKVEQEAQEEQSKKAKKKKEKAASVLDLKVTTQEILRLVEKAMKKKMAPSGMLRIVRGWNPEADNPTLVKTLAFDLFEKFFTGEYEADSIEKYAALLQHITPVEHEKNQLQLLYAAQACWFKAWLDRSPLASEKGSFLSLVQELVHLEVVNAHTVLLWRDDVDVGRTFKGKTKALFEVNVYLNTLEELNAAPEEEYEDDEEEQEEES